MYFYVVRYFAGRLVILLGGWFCWLSGTSLVYKLTTVAIWKIININKYLLISIECKCLNTCKALLTLTHIEGLIIGNGF